MARSTSSPVAVSHRPSFTGAAGRTVAANLITSLRPGQWTKNLLVFAGVLFGQRLLVPAAIARSLGAFAIFCALSGAVYVVNDIVDRDQDRLHPLKAIRPIASGALPVSTALAAAIALATVAMSGAFAISRPFAAVAVAYLALQALYWGPLKHIVILDVL